MFRAENTARSDVPGIIRSSTSGGGQAMMVSPMNNSSKLANILTTAVKLWGGMMLECVEQRFWSMKCQHESENLTLHESKERAEPNEKKINIGGEEQRSLTVFIAFFGTSERADRLRDRSIKKTTAMLCSWCFNNAQIYYIYKWFEV